MFDMSLQQMAILALVALLVLGSRNFSHPTRRGELSGLCRER